MIQSVAAAFKNGFPSFVPLPSRGVAIDGDPIGGTFPSKELGGGASNFIAAATE